MRRKWFSITGSIALALALTGCTLTPPPETQQQPQEGSFEVTDLVGFASTGGGVTGGEGGTAVKVSTLDSFLQYVNDPEPYIIQVSGVIDLQQKVIQVGSNKTIIGLGSDAALNRGGLQLTGAKNVIIRNLTFADSGGDGVDIQEGSEYIWIDHNNFSNAADGLLDIKKWSNYVTVSWNKFSAHDKTSLVGHSDTVGTDYEKLKVTYHHNWFDGTTQRHPRVRFGEVHVYNNYYNGTKLYGIGVGVEAKIYSENNYFENVEQPFRFYDNERQPGFVKDVDSVFMSSGQPQLRPEGIEWEPKKYYNYKADKAEDVKDIVMSNAGVGKIEVKELPSQNLQPDAGMQQPAQQ